MRCGAAQVQVQVQPFGGLADVLGTVIRGTSNLLGANVTGVAPWTAFQVWRGLLWYLWLRFTIVLKTCGACGQ